MTYRDDLAALAARHDALTAEVAHKTRERDETAQLLDEARRRASLPILDNIRVAAPCKASWDDMTGDDRVRFCKQCSKNVYNLSAMTRDEAHQLIAKTEDELCGRYYRRADGTIMTADCTVGVRRRRRIVAIAGALVGAAATAGAAYEVVTRAAEKPRQEDFIVGAIEVRPPPPGEYRMGLIEEVPAAHPDQDLQLSTNPTHAGATSHHDVPR